MPVQPGWEAAWNSTCNKATYHIFPLPFFHLTLSRCNPSACTQLVTPKTCYLVPLLSPVPRCYTTKEMQSIHLIMKLVISYNIFQLLDETISIVIYTLSHGMHFLEKKCPCNEYIKKSLLYCRIKMWEFDTTVGSHTSLWKAGISRKGIKVISSAKINTTLSSIFI